MHTFRSHQGQEAAQRRPGRGGAPVISPELDDEVEQQGGGGGGADQEVFGRLGLEYRLKVPLHNMSRLLERGSETNLRTAQWAHQLRSASPQPIPPAGHSHSALSKATTPRQKALLQLEQGPTATAAARTPAIASSGGGGGGHATLRGGKGKGRVTDVGSTSSTATSSDSDCDYDVLRSRGTDTERRGGGGGQLGPSFGADDGSAAASTRRRYVEYGPYSSKKYDLATGSTVAPTHGRPTSSPMRLMGTTTHSRSREGSSAGYPGTILGFNRPDSTAAAQLLPEGGSHRTAPSPASPYVAEGEETWRELRERLDGSRKKYGHAFARKTGEAESGATAEAYRSPSHRLALEEEDDDEKLQRQTAVASTTNRLIALSREANPQSSAERWKTQPTVALEQSTHRPPLPNPSSSSSSVGASTTTRPLGQGTATTTLSTQAVDRLANLEELEAALWEYVGLVESTEAKYPALFASSAQRLDSYC